ncbi:helix-turn-helix domain-containing protein [Nannocystis punicea]|uniref:TniQ protein n=1 Tax=Nannocystis punicea TaxID=2995304 RepID=A0ABY7H3Q1_9BACT|nr:helix-turn-helix domain-containing protein [Nannocystis poenicansa]WAS93900.1 hypothetical protein O0S08_47820 [Nannocystis poenicansa]
MSENKKCKHLLTLGVIIEYDEPDDDDRQYREITSRIERAIDDALGKGEDDFDDQIGWVSTRSGLLEEDPDRNCGRCCECGGWVTDRERSGAFAALAHGIFEHGRWICRDHLPNHHPRGWHFLEYDFASVAGRSLEARVVELLRSSPDLTLRELAPMLLRVPGLRELTLEQIFEPDHRFGTDDAVAMLPRGAEAAVARYLCEAVEAAHGIDSGEVGLILTCQKIADNADISSKAAVLGLNELSGRGLVEFYLGRIVVPDVARLRARRDELARR